MLNQIVMTKMWTAGFHKRQDNPDKVDRLENPVKKIITSKLVFQE